MAQYDYYTLEKCKLFTVCFCSWSTSKSFAIHFWDIPDLIIIKLAECERIQSRKQPVLP